jgi:hypothetical protein
MPIFPKIWQRIIGRKNGDSLGIVAPRFLQVFHDHGVETSQIPRLIQQIKLDELQSSEKLLAALTPEILDQTAQLFGVRIEWLEGVDDQIYTGLHCYKQPELFFEHLASLPFNPDNPLNTPLRVLTTTKQLDRNNSHHQLLAPVLLEKVAELGDEDIYRYHIYQDGFDWGYSPSRIELKALTQLVLKALHIVPLFLITDDEMEKVLEGRLIPGKFLQGCLVTNPSLEDYVMTKEESVVAKEVDELPDVKSYIEQHHLQSFSFKKTDDPQPSVFPDSQEVPRQLGKRAQLQSELWEPVRNASKTLWAENDQLPIAEVIRRIKKMPVFKASNFTESAIRKHIANLAPPGVRGKPGRKPNKST